MMYLGVDTGGTFTDLVAVDAAGRVTVRKVPSTPHSPELAILDAVERVSPPPGFDLVHGTTVATNSLLERRGAKTALLTTQGCRDVLEIGRQTRDELYSLSPSHRSPLVPRALRFEVPERLDWRGEVILPLDLAAVGHTLDEMEAAGVESVAVCFLFSFLGPEHEREAGRLARERGFLVSLSSEIAPEFREYERTSTVCANAFVMPVLSRYVGRLADRLDGAGVSRLAIMQSNGGTLRAEEAAAVAVKTVLSGPAGGLVAATRVARKAGISSILTFDMGGTSTDVALIDGDLRTVRTGMIAGLPLLTPMLDIHTVGAGGGSIARLDAGGGLRVGPGSAGADPGPVAYGRGDALTVTDANVLLGRIPPEALLGGSLKLDRERVRHAFDGFASRMGKRPEEAAEGVLAVVNATMARALRHISTERGRDPSKYTLVSFGGAGGLHVCELAELLRIPSILVPRFPGAFSALGLALADVRREAVRSLFVRENAAGEARVKALLAELSAVVKAELADEGLGPGEVVLKPFLEIQYAGQSFALRLEAGMSLGISVRRFHRLHRETYGYSDPSAPVEVVSTGVSAVGARVNVPEISVELPLSPAVPIGAAMLDYHGSRIEALLFRREHLASDQELIGPAIILQDDATTFLAPGWFGKTDTSGNLRLIPQF